MKTVCIRPPKRSLASINKIFVIPFEYKVSAALSPEQPPIQNVSQVKTKILVKIKIFLDTTNYYNIILVDQRHLTLILFLQLVIDCGLSVNKGIHVKLKLKYFVFVFYLF